MAGKAKKKMINPAVKPVKDLASQIFWGLAGEINKKNMRNRRGRPRLKRRISFDPKINYFKPRGRRMAGLEEIELKAEEIEAVRLKNIKDLDQKQGAEVMRTSPATFQRILANAYKKIALALTEGKAIKIVNRE